ncbi:alpha/beta-hydrolase [Gonapodya prolifera JEL478]|uniref:Alpha/beta-hydrolase n=1 Tax=Gonapodya prolifera (strain JEL478) TaxID=1344416 RepID=A0A139ASL3_GONPJ|nr:alpha/beta-hydrolase [Gonapodya prolifera JEL478]|eukprot:KXS19644.1 alpha/beta-hydrolase [Gonapodya prolifera JEL478]
MGNIFSRSSPAKRPLAPAPAPAPLPPSPPPPQYSSVSQVDRKPQQNSDTPDAAQKSDPQRGHPSWTPRQTTILSTLRSRPHVTARAPEELPAIRDEMEEDAAKRPLPVDIKTELVRVKREGYWKGLEEAKGAASGGGGAIECEWVEVNDNTDHVGDPSKPVVLFVHGGGFCFMSTTTHRPLTVAFARMGTRVFAINYRLAPEHPYPAPLADVITTYRYLLDEARISPSRIIIAGDSAGGNLVLAAALYLRESGMEPPAGVVAMSPWADLTGSAPSNLINVLDIGPVIPSGPVDGPKRLNHYAPNKILHRPIVSPLFSFVTGTPLPPTYIVTGDLERAFDEHVGVALKWSEDGYGRKGGVWADVFEGQVHVSVVVFGTRS